MLPHYQHMCCMYWEREAYCYVLNCVLAVGGCEARYTVTARGAPALQLGAFVFVARKRRGARVYWSCRARRAGCRARALTAAGRLLLATNTHDHAPPPPPRHRHATIESLIETIASEPAQ